MPGKWGEPLSKVDKIFILASIFCITLLTIFFGFRKVNYHCDEIWTYGLANNMGGINPEFEVGKLYTDKGPLQNFVEVQDGEAFSYFNVWENQAKDVHPPFYYLLIHTICSVFKGTFSKWFGIGLNLFWMLFIVVILYILAKKITENSFSAFIITFTYGTSVLFLDTMLLIRMYAQFTFFAVALAWLFKAYWDKDTDRNFYIKLSLIAFFGMLSHYYFLIFIFPLATVFGVHLIICKKISAVKKYVLSLVVSGLCYGITWYHILAHIFNGYRGEEAISKALTFGGLFKGFFGFVSILNAELFYGLLPVFVILSVVLIIVKFRQKDFLMGYEFYLALCLLFYMFVVGKISPLNASRYVMPIGWGVIILAYMVISSLANILKMQKYKDYIIAVVFMAINILNLISRNGYLPIDYYNSSFMEALNVAEGKPAVVFTDLDWQILYDFEILQKVENYVFVDEDIVQNTVESQKEDFIFIINTDEDIRNDIIDNLNCDLLYDDGDNFYYLVSCEG